MYTTAPTFKPEDMLQKQQQPQQQFPGFFPSSMFSSYMSASPPGDNKNSSSTTTTSTTISPPNTSAAFSSLFHSAATGATPMSPSTVFNFYDLSASFDPSSMLFQPSSFFPQFTPPNFQASPQPPQQQQQFKPAVQQQQEPIKQARRRVVTPIRSSPSLPPPAPPAQQEPKQHTVTIHTWEYSSPRIGDYDIPARVARLERYQTKRRELKFRRVRYAARSEICLQRKRVGGRFVTSSTAAAAAAAAAAEEEEGDDKREKLCSDQNSVSDEEVSLILQGMKAHVMMHV